MEGLENVGAAKAPTKKRKVVEKAAIVSGLFASFEVKSKGYQETFTSIEAANEQADILKKRAVKNKQSVSVVVSASKQDDSKAHTIRKIKIDESFFED